MGYAVSCIYAILGQQSGSSLTLDITSLEGSSSCTYSSYVLVKVYFIENTSWFSNNIF